MIRTTPHSRLQLRTLWLVLYFTQNYPRTQLVYNLYLVFIRDSISILFFPRSSIGTQLIYLHQYLLLILYTQYLYLQ